VAELSRLVDQGGDLDANLSAMAAYSPSGNYPSLQPWSPEYKGDKYRRAHPTDAFGNPVGWTPTAEDEAGRERSLAVSGGKAGFAPLEFPDQYRPDDEWLMNNPWNYGVQTLGGNVMPGDVRAGPTNKESMFNRVTGMTGSGNEGKAYQSNLDRFNKGRVAENNAVTSQMENMYSPEGLSNLDNAESTPASSGSSVFMDTLNKTGDWAKNQIGDGDASVNGFVNYAADKLSSAFKDVGGIENASRDDVWNFISTVGGFTPAALPLSVANAIIGALGYTTGDGGSFFTRNPGTQGFTRELGQGHVTGAFQNLVPFNLLGTHNHDDPNDTNAAGGVNLRDGSFVVDARTVAELGNGSSGAGQEVLARMGGRPIRGPGDGVSDSIRANIGGKQEARVARDEVKFDPKAVARIGGGDPKKGSAKLYSIMKKAEKARKSASRGKDTGLRALAGVR